MLEKFNLLETPERFFARISKILYLFLACLLLWRVADNFFDYTWDVEKNLKKLFLKPMVTNTVCKQLKIW
jgi:hypothetical protein